MNQYQYKRRSNLACRLLVELLYSYTSCIRQEGDVVEADYTALAKRVSTQVKYLVAAFEWLHRQGLITDLALGRYGAKFKLVPILDRRT